MKHRAPLRSERFFYQSFLFRLASWFETDPIGQQSSSDDLITRFLSKSALDLFEGRRRREWGGTRAVKLIVHLFIDLNSTRSSDWVIEQLAGRRSPRVAKITIVRLLSISPILRARWREKLSLSLSPSRRIELRNEGSRGFPTRHASRVSRRRELQPSWRLNLTRCDKRRRPRKW